MRRGRRDARFIKLLFTAMTVSRRGWSVCPRVTLHINHQTDGGSMTRPYRLPAACKCRCTPGLPVSAFSGCRKHSRADSGHLVIGLRNAGGGTLRTLDYLEARGALVQRCDQRVRKLGISSRGGKIKSHCWFGKCEIKHQLKLPGVFFYYQ